LQRQAGCSESCADSLSLRAIVKARLKKIHRAPNFLRVVCKTAILWPGPKKQITLRIDPDVLTFFRKHGRGYQTTMNAVLRKYMEAQRGQAV
jgi:uncharacterized protein (DUF4415 family)